MSGKRGKGVDPTWPVVGDGEHVLSELNTSTQGALSPFGEVEFPIPPEDLPYIHPTTVINR